MHQHILRLIVEAKDVSLDACTGSRREVLLPPAVIATAISLNFLLPRHSMR